MGCEGDWVTVVRWRAITDWPVPAGWVGKAILDTGNGTTFVSHPDGATFTEGTGWWADEVRPATQEETALAQLASLEGL